jgi:predicted DNA-binding transcriptional regulator YafY
MADPLAHLPYAQNQRLQYIESVALWEGLVGRPRVAEVFGVSGNHITRDFTLYRKTFPGNLEYDVTARGYRPGKRFRPRIGNGSAEEYLSLLRAYVETSSVAVLPSVGGEIVAEALPLPKSQYDNDVLREITRAIRQHHGVRLSYQSLRRDKAVARDFWPHALVYTTMRWHVRGYDALRQRYADFTLMRMSDASPSDVRPDGMPDVDSEWETFEAIEVRPAACLAPAQARIVAREYGMTLISGRWVWRVELRRCLVNYFLRALRLDLDASLSFPFEPAPRELVRRFSYDDDSGNAFNTS